MGGEERIAFPLIVRANGTITSAALVRNMKTYPALKITVIISKTRHVVEQSFKDDQMGQSHGQLFGSINNGNYIVSLENVGKQTIKLQGFSNIGKANFNSLAGRVTDHVNWLPNLLVMSVRLIYYKRIYQGIYLLLVILLIGSVMMMFLVRI